MILGIRQKLMIAFVGLSLLITLLAFVVMLFSFRAGFLQYVNDLRFRSLQQFHETLSDEVTTMREWRSIVRHRRQWHDLIRDHYRKAGAPLKPSKEASRSTLHDKPPKSFTDKRDKHFDGRPPKRKKGGGPRPIYMLFDANQQIIYGDEQADANLNKIPITVEDQLVGYVGLPELRRLNDNADKAFVARQTRYFTICILLSALLAIIVAFFLSQWMTSPLKRIVSAMNRLVARDYAANVTYGGKDEIGNLVQAFNRLTNALAEHESSQQQWIADISHELRTPLATLKGELEALQDGVRVLSISRIDSLHEEITRLQRLVDDLHQLSLSDLGAMRYRFESIDMLDVIDDAVIGIQLSNHDLSFSIRAERDNYIVYGDSDRLLQLFRNLLQNSIRYTDTPGQIQVTVRHTADNNVWICWEDSSPGVDGEALPKLFDRLYRAEQSRNREQGGSGLGLSICYAIVKAHSGKITAQRSSLGGLAVEIELPNIAFKGEQ